MIFGYCFFVHYVTFIQVNALNMFFKILLVLLCSNCIDSKNFMDVVLKNCEVLLEPQPICAFYEFDEDCLPWKINLCVPKSYTINEQICPKYICPVKFI